MDSVDGNCFQKMQSETEENNNTMIPAKTAYTTSNKFDLYYNMNHKKRGLAYIFNHQRFRVCSERHGTKEDADLLSITLRHLNFDINVFTDLNYTDIMYHMKNAAEFDHSDYDCFLVVILTHGDTNILWAHDRSYSIHDIFDTFTADMCPTLAGKPKMFIFQACQGESLDPGITMIQRTETDGPGSRSRYQIPVRADFLIVHATFTGYYAFRNPEKGSYFIAVLCKEFQEKGTSENILVILTRVNQRVAVSFLSNSSFPDRNKKKQMPYFQSSLTRLLQFQ